MTFWKSRLIALVSAVVMLVALASPALAGGNTHTNTQFKPHHNEVDDSFNTDNSSNNNDTITNTDDSVDTAAGVCTALGGTGDDDIDQQCGNF